MDKTKFSHIMLNYLENGNPVITLFNDEVGTKTKKAIIIDTQTGDIKDFTIGNSYVHSDIYYAGNRKFFHIQNEGYDDLLKNEISMLPE